MNKEEFINFLMEKKYALTREENLLDHLKGVVTPPPQGEMLSFLCSLKVSWDPQEGDKVFAFLNGNPQALKLLKDKEESKRFPELVLWYKKAFEENKKYLKDFNTQDRKKDNKKDRDDKQINTTNTTNTINTTPPVVTRFPPEPSGFLHIGHAKAALVNVSLAEKGKGRMILRFDDTNPEKKYKEFEEQIVKDLKDLGIEEYTVSHSSDYFPFLIEKAKWLIKEGRAYCDNTPQEEMRRERMEGIESKCREGDPSTNLEIFERMCRGEAQGYCLRAKINMKDPNKAMRDPVIFRSTPSTHHRVGDSLHAFPTYDFTCPILDSVEGVTVACRSNEYRDRNSQYRWFLKTLSLENKPKIFDFSRLNFEDTVLSKRKIHALIEEGKVKGWDDPRLSTIQGIKRAGMDLSVLREYILLQGASQKTSTISWDKVWAMNKKAIDGYSPRFMAVPVEGAVTVRVKGVVPHLKTHPLHPKKDLGTKSLIYDSLVFISQEDASLLQEGEEFTFMHWGNGIVKKKGEDLEVDLHLEGDFKKTKNKISWVSKLGCVLVRTFEIGNLFKEEKFNEESLKEVWYYGESSLGQVEGHVQFERIGFFFKDGPYEFNLVKGTKQKRKERV